MRINTQFAVIRVENGQPVQTLWVGKSIRQERITISNRRFLDDYSNLKIYQGTSALNWQEVVK